MGGGGGGDLNIKRISLVLFQFLIGSMNINNLNELWPAFVLQAARKEKLKMWQQNEIRSIVHVESVLEHW